MTAPKTRLAGMALALVGPAVLSGCLSANMAGGGSQAECPVSGDGTLENLTSPEGRLVKIEVANEADRDLCLRAWLNQDGPLAVEHPDTEYAPNVKTMFAGNLTASELTLTVRETHEGLSADRTFSLEPENYFVVSVWESDQNPHGRVISIERYDQQPAHM